MFVCFYTERKPEGKPNQFWAPNVYLHDQWEIFPDHDSASARFEDVWKRDDVHSAGVAKIDPELSTDWF